MFARQSEHAQFRTPGAYQEAWQQGNHFLLFEWQLSSQLLFAEYEACGLQGTFSTLFRAQLVAGWDLLGRPPKTKVLFELGQIERSRTNCNRYG